MLPQIEHRYIRANGITLHVAQAGPEGGPLLILLHGFPEFWYAWRYQIPAFVEAGFRVCAPDQRGYNLSDKPHGVAAYGLDELSADIIGLIDAYDSDRAYLVGHDWGGAVAWWTANKYPARLSKLGILNVPHHAVMRHYIQNSWRQKLKSWYILLFQLAWLPELAIRLAKYRPLGWALRKSSRTGTFTPADLELYRRAWSQPGSLTAMIHWYRASRQARPKRLPGPRIVVPTLVIWGAHDPALGREMAQPSIDLCQDGRLTFIEDASHFVQHESPERVNQLLLRFLTADEP
jgi:pimeloyl-ACP methyl ester carboxylesterase